MKTFAETERETNLCIKTFVELFVLCVGVSGDSNERQKERGHHRTNDNEEEDEK